MVFVASLLFSGGGVVFAEAPPRKVRAPSVAASEAGEIDILHMRAVEARRCGALPQATRHSDARCLAGWDAGSLMWEFADLQQRCPACTPAIADDLAALRRIHIAQLEDTFHIFELDFRTDYWNPDVRRGMIRVCARLLAGTEGIPVTAHDAADICTLDPTAHIRCALDIPDAVVEYFTLLQATAAPSRQVQDVALFLHRFAVDPRPFVCEGCAAFTPIPHE